jgi:bacillithiol biosynthesis deacetylase BshB1
MIKVKKGGRGTAGQSSSCPDLGCTILAFGAHPDDIELTVGGTLCKASKAGYRAVAVDLTRGETGTRGTPDRRLKEAEKAAAILGLAARENLGLPDGGLECRLEERRTVAGAIRRHRPEIVLAPWVEDTHPDHAAAGQIVRAAFFDARLAKLDLQGEPWFARLLLFFPCRQYRAPTVVIDVTEERKVKEKAFRAHRSQMGGKGKKEFRPPGVMDPFKLTEARDRHYGSLVGAQFGEGLIATDPLPLTSLALLCCEP